MQSEREWQNQDLQDFQDEQDLTNFRECFFIHESSSNPVHPENPANPDSAFTFRETTFGIHHSSFIICEASFIIKKLAHNYLQKNKSPENT